MSNVSIEKQKLDILANAISAKSGEPVTMTLEEMVEAVDGIDSPEDGNNMKYGSSSYLIGVAKIGTGYVWTTYSGDDMGIVGSAETETAVAV